MISVTTYRIGWWTHAWWPRAALIRCLVRGAQPDGRLVPRRAYLDTMLCNLRLIRRPHRPWQAEVTVAGCSCNARRSFTVRGAERNVRALHAKRTATPVAAGTPVAGKTGVCWLALSAEQRRACV